MGDSFDYINAAHAIDDETRMTLVRLQAGREWIWIEGNHDPGPVELGGSHKAELTIGSLTFRHIAETDPHGEVSGHYHPKAAIAGAARKPCFLLDSARVILPAFGVYTGGLSARHEVLANLMAPKALAILTGGIATAVPLAACLKR